MRGVPRLAGLLVRYRLRHAFHAFGARPTGPAGFVVLLALASSVAYVLLFASAFDVIGRVAGVDAQAAALALMTGAVALSSFGAKASAGDAALAGTPENEFLLTRPLSIWMLVAARSLAAMVTDPFGALFLFPVLVAAALAWQLPAASWAVAFVVSISAQFAITAAAQAAQIALVRWVPRRHRSSAWVCLRLVAVASLAAVWMTATWILRAPSRFAPWLLDAAGALALTPAGWLAAPLVAFRRAGAWSAAAELLPVVGGAVAVAVASVLVARRAGMWGWEEAGAPWAESSSSRSSTAERGPLTPARREWRNLVRDRARLAAFIALPAILVGVQIFGTIGWHWSTATIDRVAMLTFSVTLYMATLGPLAHMQTERRAFWIMRVVPVPLGRLMAAKARAWALLLGGVAAILFSALAVGVPHAPAGEILRAGILVVGGTVAMTVLAVGSGCLAADLSDEQRSALGPGSVYLFLLIGGLYNLVLRARGAWLLVALAFHALVVVSTWRAGIAHARLCLDAEALARRTFTLSDASRLSLIAVFGSIAVARGLDLVEAPPDLGPWARLAVLGGTAVAAIWMIARGRVRRPPPGI